MLIDAGDRSLAGDRFLVIVDGPGRLRGLGRDIEGTARFTTAGGVVEPTKKRCVTFPVPSRRQLLWPPVSRLQMRSLGGLEGSEVSRSAPLQAQV